MQLAATSNSGNTRIMCVLLCRQCALAALRDVKLYLTEEAGQIAVSSDVLHGV